MEKHGEVWKHEEKNIYNYDIKYSNVKLHVMKAEKQMTFRKMDKIKSRQKN